MTMAATPRLAASSRILAIAFGGGNGFERVGEHSEVVAGRHANACIPKIYAECLFH